MSYYAAFKPGTYEFDGLMVKAPNPYLILCKERGIGIILPAAVARAYKPKHVRWTTADAIMEQAKIDRAELTRRIRDGWSGWDLFKPDGWQRVVDARRNGITWEGVHDSLRGWAQRLRLTELGLMRRLGDASKPMEGVMGDTLQAQRVDTARAPEGVPSEPLITPSGSIKGVFFYNGAVDTLAGHCRHAGISIDTVRYRLRRKDKNGNKMSVAQALSTPKGDVPRSDKGVPNKRKGYRDALKKLADAQPDYIPSNRPSFMLNRNEIEAERARSEADFEALGGQAGLDRLLGTNYVEQQEAEREAKLAQIRAERPQLVGRDDLIPSEDQ